MAEKTRQGASGPMLFFALDVPRGLLMQVWSAALNGRTSTKDRICRYRCRMFPCAIHTTNSHSQSTAYWQFLNRGSRPHLRNFLFQRLHSSSFCFANHSRSESSVTIGRTRGIRHAETAQYSSQLQQ